MVLSFLGNIFIGGKGILGRGTSMMAWRKTAYSIEEPLLVPDTSRSLPRCVLKYLVWYFLGLNQNLQKWCVGLCVFSRSLGDYKALRLGAPENERVEAQPSL